MRSICFIAARYPNDLQPAKHVFLQRLVMEIADMGIQCTVIAPIPSHQARFFRSLPYHVVQITKQGNKVHVFFPRYFSLSESVLLGIKLSHITINGFFAACISVIKKECFTPDAFYGHFICMAGICACRLGRALQKPAFIAYGESTEWSIKRFGMHETQRELRSITGIISVSSHNKDVLIKYQVAPTKKIRVFPNGIDTNIFSPIDRCQARKQFGLPEDCLIAAFVGQFIKRKGLPELLAAIKPFPKLRLICAGAGPIQLDSPQVLYSAKVKPCDMPAFLSAADLFVLPTKNEGCCNAILEAMACGLPIVSSALPFNADILNNDSAILVNPDNVHEISQAIGRLLEDSPLRNRLGSEGRKRALHLSLEERARNIIEWMQELSEH